MAGRHGTKLLQIDALIVYEGLKWWWWRIGRKIQDLLQVKLFEEREVEFVRLPASIPVSANWSVEFVRLPASIPVSANWSWDPRARLIVLESPSGFDAAQCNSTSFGLWLNSWLRLAYVPFQGAPKDAASPAARRAPARRIGTGTHRLSSIRPKFTGGM